MSVIPDITYYTSARLSSLCLFHVLPQLFSKYLALVHTFIYAGRKLRLALTIASVHSQVLKMMPQLSIMLLIYIDNLFMLIKHDHLTNLEA